MYPAIRDEVYRIAREAVVNAFRHSQATNVEVRLKYTWSRFSLMVCDNGIGIGESIVKQGKDGHWGLQGMRERALGIGAKMTLMTRPMSGTVVELTVPGRVAFQSRFRGTFRSLFLGVEPSSGDHKDIGSEPK
jgi:signal transduction histidine kinase